MGNGSKEFKCPSCSASMKFEGGESIFQTCKSCQAPIIVPSEILYPKEKQIAYEQFATLAKDIPVDVEQVTNDLTSGDSPPPSDDVIAREAQIEKFEVYQEKIGASSIKQKQAFDNLVAPSEKMGFDTIAPLAVDEAETTLERIKSELRAGDKIEAIKIYRDHYGKSLKEAKEIVEAIEQEEFSVGSVGG